jgi:pimeloyl-ACP methyl ester carboxylesterase
MLVRPASSLPEASLLACRRTPAVGVAVAPTAFLLPGSFDECDALLDLTRAAGLRAPFIEVQPPRAIFTGERLRGSCWFHRIGAVVEPHTFIDALWHLERLVLHHLESNSGETSPILVGSGEGAALCVSIAPYLAERIRAIILLDGFLPSVSGWTPPATDLSGMPAWIVGPPTDPDASSIGTWLAQRGALVHIVGANKSGRAASLAAIFATLDTDPMCPAGHANCQ